MCPKVHGASPLSEGSFFTVVVMVLFLLTGHVLYSWFSFTRMVSWYSAPLSLRAKSHTTIFTLKQRTVQGFCTLTRLRKHHHHLFLEHCLPPTGSPVPLAASSPGLLSANHTQ